MSDTKTEVFCLTASDGRLLPPAVQATVLAKYSRSRLSARQIISQLTSEEADKFQEKWVIEFNHSCYDSSTEVLTKTGFVPWPDVNADMSLASLNQNTGYIEYIKPKKVIHESYPGIMYMVK